MNDITGGIYKVDFLLLSQEKIDQDITTKHDQDIE